MSNNTTTYCALHPNGWVQRLEATSVEVRDGSICLFGPDLAVVAVFPAVSVSVWRADAEAARKEEYA